jgi:hypothetical protein
MSSSMLTAPSAGASVAGDSVAGISVAGDSVAGISVAGASVAGISVAAGGWVAAPPHAANREANTSNVNRLNNSFLVFILFSPLSLVVNALRSLGRYYITAFVEIR